MQTSITVLVAFLAAALPATPASAISDHKSIHGSQCVAGGSGTTAAELSYGAFGVSNLSNNDEMVICPIPIDIEEAWSQTGTDPTQMVVHYRTGNSPARIICTTFSGSIAVQNGAVVTATRESITQAANSITNQLAVTPFAANWSETAPPVTVVSIACILGPKLKLGGIFMQEMHATHLP